VLFGPYFCDCVDGFNRRDGPAFWEMRSERTRSMMSDASRAVDSGSSRGHGIPAGSSTGIVLEQRLFGFGCTALSGRAEFLRAAQIGAISPIVVLISPNCGGSQSGCSPIPTDGASSRRAGWRMPARGVVGLMPADTSRNSVNSVGGEFSLIVGGCDPDLGRSARL